MKHRFSFELKFLLPSLTVAVISGCTTVGPDYEEPEVAAMQAWETNLYGQFGGTNGLTAGDLEIWWEMFDDPTLNRLIKITQEANLSLQGAGLRILESRAALGLAESGRYPQVQQATGAINYVNTQQSNGSGQDSGNYNLGGAVGWELDFWGKFKRGIESADAAFFASVANQQNLQLLLNAQVADLYYAYRTTLLRIEIARSNAIIQGRSFEITEKLYKGGDKSELDLQQAKTQYMSTLSTIPGLEIQQVQLRNSLCLLAGRAPGDLPELEDNLDTLPELSPVVVHEIPASLLMRRPDVRAAAFLVAAQSAQVGVAEAGRYPSVSLLGTLGWSGTTISGTPETLALGIGPSFSWNIFDYGRTKNNIRIQDSRLQQAIVNFQNIVIEAAGEIDNASINVVKTKEQQAPQRLSTEAANRSLELANARYKEGYADFQRVIEAQRSVAAQTDRELVNQSSHISSVIRLYKALGGGWSVTAVEQLVSAETRETMEARTDWDDLLTAPLPAPTPLSEPIKGESHE